MSDILQWKEKDSYNEECCSLVYFFLSLNYLHSRRTLGSCFTSDYGSQLSVILKSLIDGDDWQAPLKGSLLKISFKKGKCAICEFGSLKNIPKVISLASERRKKKGKM